MGGIIGRSMIPIGDTFNWQGKLIWLHASSNILNALACFLIPGLLFYISSKRRDIFPRWICLIFIVPLIFSGLSYSIMLLNIWYPAYELAAIIKLASGLASWLCFFLILYLLPKLLKMSSLQETQVHERKIDGIQRFLWSLKGQVPEQPGMQRTSQNLDNVDQHLRELAVAKQELERSNAAQSRFLANMSHEIRTPLAGITGYSDQLLFDRTLRAQHRESVEAIKKCTNHLRYLLNDILDVSKIEADKLVIQKEPFNLMTVLHELVTIIEGKMKSGKLKLEIVFENPIPDRIFTDPLRLRQILINVVGNAVKFTDEGVITVRIEAKALKKSVKTWALEIAVIDTGCGIPFEFQSELFKRFSQAEAAYKMRNAGSGLGLFLSRTLVRQLGGDVTLEKSEPGQGSTFLISLPLDIMYDSLFIEKFVQFKAKAEALVIPNPIEGRLDGLAILIVEDGVDNQRIFSHFLKMAGARIVIVEDGMAALDRVWSDDSFDLILMDIQIPILNGYEVTDRLRKGGFTKPIIAVTAHSLQGEKPHDAEIGISDFLAKPVEIERLIDTIQRHGSRSRRMQPMTNDAAEKSPYQELAEEQVIRSKYHDNRLYQGIIISFIQSFEQRVDDIESQIGQEDWEKLAYSLHQMKGAAATYGYPIVSEIAGQMEDSVKNSDRDGMALLTIRGQAERMKGISIRMKGGLASLEQLQSRLM